MFLERRNLGLDKIIKRSVTAFVNITIRKDMKSLKNFLNVGTGKIITIAMFALLLGFFTLTNPKSSSAISKGDCSGSGGKYTSGAGLLGDLGACIFPNGTWLPIT